MRALTTILVLSTVLAGCASDEADPPTTTEPTPSPGAPREDTKTFTLPSRGNVEWKFRLAEGAQMTYEWTATRPVYFDFHGDHDDGTDNFVSHKEATLASDADTFTAPFAGRHGWFFANGNSQTITITLHTKGAYEVVGQTGGNVRG